MYLQNSKMQYQQLMLTRGFQSSSDTTAAFWVGYLSVIDSMLIVWPDQKFQVLKNIPANRTANCLIKKKLQVYLITTCSSPNRKNYLKISAARSICNWKHKEE